MFTSRHAVSSSLPDFNQNMSPQRTSKKYEAVSSARQNWLNPHSVNNSDIGTARVHVLSSGHQMCPFSELPSYRETKLPVHGEFYAKELSTTSNVQ